MNFQQLAYIVAVDNERHFARAAQECCVTQPTLSMMIQKLEDELNTKIFDRSQQPISPTNQGKQIIEQARIILSQQKLLREMVKSEADKLEGEVSIGIIPTLAAYLVPLFLRSFLHNYPGIRLKIEEANTEIIIEKLKKGSLDIGLLATPLKESYIEEFPLFYEEFFLYNSHPSDKQYIVPEEINPHELLLLEEGHCLRSQVVNLCQLAKDANARVKYLSGSLETLKRLVENEQGITILPELAALDLPAEKQGRLMRFKPPSPVREISLVVHNSFVKRRLLESLKAEILAGLPEQVHSRKEYQLIEL